MKKKVKERNNWTIWIAIIILTLFIIYLDWDDETQEIKEQEKINPLIEILEFEIASATEYFRIMEIDPVCLDYSLYYNESLRKYNGMDIRFPRYVLLCDKSICGENKYHTYILVNFRNSNCILDQKSYTCIHRKIPEIKLETNLSQQNKTK